MKHAPIIEQPALQSGTQRVIHGLVTALAWFGWAYLTWPFLGIIVTALGIPVVSDQQVFRYSASLLADLKSIMWWCVITVILCATLFPSWAGYHIARFGAASKRKINVRAGIEKLAADFQVPQATVALVQSGKRIVLERDQLVVRVASVDQSETPSASRAAA